MKILLAISYLVSALTLFAQQSPFSSPNFVGGLTTVSGTNITCNVWQDFEFDGSVTATALTNSAHGATNSWYVTGADLSTSGSGERKVLNRPNSNTDAGTRGLSYSTTLDNVEYVQCRFAATDTASAGMWLYGPSLAVNASCYVLNFLDEGSNTRAYVRFRLNTTYFLSMTVSGNTEEISCSSDTWYWVSLKYTKSGTCSMAVFDTTGAQVGVTKNISDSGAQQITRLWIAQSYASTATAATVYYDDLLIDTTDATFPLGP